MEKTEYELKIEMSTVETIYNLQTKLCAYVTGEIGEYEDDYGVLRLRDSAINEASIYRSEEDYTFDLRKEYDGYAYDPAYYDGNAIYFYLKNRLTEREIEIIKRRLTQYVLNNGLSIHSVKEIMKKTVIETKEINNIM